MSSHKLTFSIEWFGNELKGTADYYPGDPGRVSGPPEKCYPPEPDELDILTLTHNGHDVHFMLDSETVLEQIHDLVYATLEQDEPDYPEYEPEEPWEDPVQADADVLRSAGMGTDEDYGYFGENDGY